MGKAKRNRTIRMKAIEHVPISNKRTAKSIARAMRRKLKHKTTTIHYDPPMPKVPPMDSHTFNMIKHSRKVTRRIKQRIRNRRKNETPTIL